MGGQVHGRQTYIDGTILASSLHGDRFACSCVLTLISMSQFSYPGYEARSVLAFEKRN